MHKKIKKNSESKEFSVMSNQLEESAETPTS